MARISLKLRTATILSKVFRKEKDTMQTTKSTKKSDLKEAFALWENKKGSTTYYTGKTSGDDPVRIVAFINDDKKNPKEPDIRVYEQVEKGQKKPDLASLWANKSKAGKEYFSGNTNDNEKLVAFINDDTQDGKYPAIRVYFSNDNK